MGNRGNICIGTDVPRTAGTTPGVGFSAEDYAACLEFFEFCPPPEPSPTAAPTGKGKGKGKGGESKNKSGKGGSGGESDSCPCWDSADTCLAADGSCASQCTEVRVAGEYVASANDDPIPVVFSVDTATTCSLTLNDRLLVSEAIKTLAQYEACVALLEDATEGACNCPAPATPIVRKAF